MVLALVKAVSTCAQTNLTADLNDSPVLPTESNDRATDRLERPYTEGSGCSQFPGNITAFSWREQAKPQKTSVRVDSVLAKIRTDHFPTQV